MTTMRRTFKPEFKARMVLEKLAGLKSTAEIYRKHRIRPQVFSRWKVELLGRTIEINGIVFQMPANSSDHG